MSRLQLGQRSATGTRGSRTTAGGRHSVCGPFGRFVLLSIGIAHSSRRARHIISSPVNGVKEYTKKGRARSWSSGERQTENWQQSRWQFFPLSPI